MVIVLVPTGTVHRQPDSFRMKRIIFVSVLFVVALAVWWWGGVRRTPPTAPAADGVGTAVVTVLRSATREASAVRGEYFTFLSAASAFSTWNKVVFGGGEQPVPLNDFLAAVGISVDNGLIARIDQQGWYLYQCAPTGSGGVGGGNVVLALRFMKQQDPLDIQRSLLAWEVSMVPAVSALVFPYDLYRTSPVATGGFVSASEYSYATLRTVPVRVEGYEQGEIGYLYFGQDLLIGGDRRCLREAEERLFEVR